MEQQALINKKVEEGGTVKTTQSIDPGIFSKIPKSLFAMFVKIFPEEVNRKFSLFALEVTPIYRIQADTFDDRNHVHQANQIHILVTIGVEASVLTYLSERREEEAN